MGGPYNIPRNYKGENKILYIFSRKALAYTAIGAGIGFVFYSILGMLNLQTVGIVILIILALLGYVIGTFKVPEASKFEITRKTGGEPIDEIILRWIKFKSKKKKIYVYREEVHKDV